MYEVSSRRVSILIKTASSCTTEVGETISKKRNRRTWQGFTLELLNCYPSFGLFFFILIAGWKKIQAAKLISTDMYMLIMCNQFHDNRDVQKNMYEN